jgi:hypothetical protein
MLEIIKHHIPGCISQASFQNSRKHKSNYCAEFVKRKLKAAVIETADDADLRGF